MPAFRSVVSVLLRALGDFLYTLKAGPAGGLRPPSGPATTRRSPGNRPHRPGQPAPTPQPDRHVVLTRPWGHIGATPAGPPGTTAVNAVSRRPRSADRFRGRCWSARHPGSLSHGGSQGFKSPHLHPTTDDQQNAGHRHIRGRPRPAYRRYVDLALCRGKQPGGPSSAAGPARLTAPAPRPAG